MADANLQNVHYDELLANFAVGFRDSRFIGDRLFPRVPVAKSSDKYLVMSRGETRIEDDALGSNDYPKEASFGWSDDNYSCNDHARGNFLPDKVLSNASGEPTARALSDMSRTSFLTRLLLANHEKAVVTAMGTSGNYATALTDDLDSASDGNFDDSGKNGVDIIIRRADVMELQTGVRPNIGVVSRDAFTKMLADANFKGTFTTSLQPEEAIKQQIAAALGLDELLIGSSAYNSAEKGQTPVMARLWPSNGVWLAYVEPNVSWETPSLGKTFVWNPDTRPSSGGFAVKKVRDERRGSGGEHLDVYWCYDVKATGKDEAGKIIAGCYLRNAYAAL